jgi:hydroxymethylglutaryl-CoA reductase (NADPH)
VSEIERRSLELVPRFGAEGYEGSRVAARRRWAEERTGARLAHVGSFSIDSAAMRGNIENPIGAVQVPLGLAGPLRLEGENGREEYWVPLATTEGALVRSVERGMVAIARAGAARTAVWLDQNRITPSFVLADVVAARRFAEEVRRNFSRLAEIAATTTRRGSLVGLDCRPMGREVLVELRFDTADAHGMNMIAKAASAVCAWIQQHLGGGEVCLFSGAEGEKHASGSLLAGGKGKTVTADVRLPPRVVASVLQTTPEAISRLWRRTVRGHLASATLGYNGHLANALTALFIACGQDVANIANAALGITVFETDDDGSLYASVTLPSLTVGTVGGGSGQGTALECLSLLHCAGEGGSRRFAAIAAATALAGEISFAGALASGAFVAGHEAYGRNRPAVEGQP